MVLVLCYSDSVLSASNDNCEYSNNRSEFSATDENSDLLLTVFSFAYWCLAYFHLVWIGLDLEVLHVIKTNKLWYFQSLTYMASNGCLLRLQVFMVQMTPKLFDSQPFFLWLFPHPAEQAVVFCPPSIRCQWAETQAPGACQEIRQRDHPLQWHCGLQCLLQQACIRRRGHEDCKPPQWPLHQIWHIDRLPEKSLCL